MSKYLCGNNCSNGFIQVTSIPFKLITSLEYGSKLIGRILDMNNDLSNIDIIYIATKAYRVITDPDCGFYKKASCSTDDNFSDLYRGLAALFEPRILKLYEMITLVVGSEILGVSKIILEPVLLAEGKQADIIEFRNDVQEKEAFLKIFLELHQMPGSGLCAEKIMDAFYLCENDSKNISKNSVSRNEKHLYSSEVEIDKKIERFLKDWKKSSGSKTLNTEDFLIVPPVGEKWGNTVNHFKLEDNLVLATFEELIKLIPANPYNEFIKGNYFIGKLLYHSDAAIQSAASASLRKMVKFSPKYRLR